MDLLPPTGLDLSVEVDLDRHRIRYTPIASSGARTIAIFLAAVALLAALGAAAISPVIDFVSLFSAVMAALVVATDTGAAGGEIELTPARLRMEIGADRLDCLLEDIVSVRVFSGCLELSFRDGSRRLFLMRGASTLPGWLAPLITEHVERRRLALDAEGHDLAAEASPPEALLALSRRPTSS
jgi:hypothetical protein